MKFLFINNGLGMGGIEVVTANYLSLMKKRGLDVSFLEFWHKKSSLYSILTEAHVPLYTIFHYRGNLISKIINKVFGNLIIRRQVGNIIEKGGFNIIHLQTYNESIPLERCNLDKVFFTLHSDLNRFLINLSPNGVAKFKKLVENGMHIIALSEKSRQDILDFCPVADLHVIPNGLDIKKIQSEKYDRNKLCQELGLPADAFILGHVGRFNKVKNHEKLIDIFNCLHKKCPNSYLLLVGTGREFERKHVHNLVNQYGLQDKVKFLGVRQDATAIMSCFDAFALPSFQESFSLVLVEAQAQGVRCVASDTVPDEVICNDNCFKLSINKSSEDWAELLLSNSEVRRGKDVNVFDINNVVNELIKVYYTHN